MPEKGKGFTKGGVRKKDEVCRLGRCEEEG